MEKYLKPERFSADPSSNTSAKEWKHWKQTFESFLEAIADPAPTDANKRSLLNNLVSPEISDMISECTSYTEAVALNQLSLNKRMKSSLGTNFVHVSRNLVKPLTSSCYN